MKLCLSAQRQLTSDISEFVLSHPDAKELPPFSPGSHITVQTPSGAMRRYSLINDGEAPAEYVIAIKREAQSRGGSQSMHDQLHVGDVLEVQAPENSFPLGCGSQYLLIAGGIGITPIYAMAKHLVKLGVEIEMIYCTRDPDETAYKQELEELLGDKLILHHDGGDLSQIYDFWDHFEKPDKRLVYCCGPGPMIEEIKSISGHWREGGVNFEEFNPVEIVRKDDKAFQVTINSTGTTYEVPADKTILETLRESGIATASSCESGTCGTCKCGLLSGDADHRDMVLMDEEKSDHIMLCVSRANGGELLLDL